MIVIKRIYEPKASNDGCRVLVDRLWPRGVSKEKAALDEWMKDIGPSDELRKWFNHDPAKWAEFKKKYQVELKDKKDLLKQLKNLEAKHKKLTLLYGAHDQEHNQAVVISEFLK
ncbi:MAG TPA: DUF488 domain-containing protein [Candidatus Saccharimonadales bacterium]|nr:DUF488 domain-containing protein [Candidatus Saccharimonadales bacterium]